MIRKTGKGSVRVSIKTDIPYESDGNYGYYLGGDIVNIKDLGRITVTSVGNEDGLQTIEGIIENVTIEHIGGVYD